tara:strand:- start:1262 stop:1609 length:348 start_codon:yes stop_codon:yes gene_type:complete
MDMTISGLMKESHNTSVSKGWWDDSNRNIGELLALVHSEVSEALEAYRITGASGLNNIWLRDKDGKPEGFTIELADTLIRIFDISAAYELDLENALKIKMEFNKSRPYRHGNKKA